MIMSKEKKKKEMVICPVGRFFQDLEESMGKESKFYEHLNRSRVEFLRAIRVLVDEKIENLEKRGARKGKKKISKIKIE
jgi:hypothetical protein